MTGASAGETLISEQSKGSKALVATGFKGGCSRNTLSGLSGRIKGSLPDREGTETRDGKAEHFFKCRKHYYKSVNTLQVYVLYNGL